MHASCLSYLLALAAAGADTQQYLRAQNNNYTQRERKRMRERNQHTQPTARTLAAQLSKTRQWSAQRSGGRAFLLNKNNTPCHLPLAHTLARFYSFCVWMGQTSLTDSRRSAYTILVYFLRFLRIWLRNIIEKCEI